MSGAHQASARNGINDQPFNLYNVRAYIQRAQWRARGLAAACAREGTRRERARVASRHHAVEKPFRGGACKSTNGAGRGHGGIVQLAGVVAGARDIMAAAKGIACSRDKSSAAKNVRHLRAAA